MIEAVKKDIQDVIWDATQFLENSNSSGLRELSNRTVHNASIYQDKDSIAIAVIVYALSKIIDRISSGSLHAVQAEVIEGMKNAGRKIEAGDYTGYENAVKDIIDSITKIDTKMNLYIQKVISEAGIKKGSRIYEHGISAAQTAEIFGISQWELMKYIGQTNIAEEFNDEVKIADRLSAARKLFGIKV